MKIIFLDIDGVLNCQSAYKKGECKYKSLPTGDHYQGFGKTQKHWLNKLIYETGSKIVVSSTWRKDGIEKLNDIWKHEEMAGEIIGLTPSMFINDNIRTYDDSSFSGVTTPSVPRGVEINAWLMRAGFIQINWDRDIMESTQLASEISNYIIIDDDSDMLYKHRNHFVHVLPPPRNFEGFGEDHYNLGKIILNKSCADVIYGVETS